MRKYNLEWWQLLLTATPEQQSSPATARPMLVKKLKLVTFYDELSSLVRSIPKHNMLVIGGDMNAQIGKKTEKTNTASTTRLIGMVNIKQISS